MSEPRRCGCPCNRLLPPGTPGYKKFIDENHKMRARRRDAAESRATSAALWNRITVNGAGLAARRARQSRLPNGARRALTVAPERVLLTT